MEEELASIVQNYGVLYDKATKEFYRKDVKQDAWRAVAEQMGIEDGRLTSDSEKKLKKPFKNYVTDTRGQRREFKNV